MKTIFGCVKNLNIVESFLIVTISIDVNITTLIVEATANDFGKNIIPIVNNSTTMDGIFPSNVVKKLRF